MFENFVFWIAPIELYILFIVYYLYIMMLYITYVCFLDTKTAEAY